MTGAGDGVGDLPPAAPPTAAPVLSWLLDLGRSGFRNPSNSLLGFGDPLVPLGGDTPMAAGAVFLFSNLGLSLGRSLPVGEEGQEVFLSSLLRPPSPRGAGMLLQRDAPCRSLSLRFVCDDEDKPAAPCD